MSMFAVVHDPENISRAYGEISDFLALRHRRSLDVRCEPLIGIWIDSDMSSEVAARLHEEAAVASCRLGQIPESISLGSVWTLCCLTGQLACRASLADALRKVSLSSNIAAARFVPVLRSDLSSSQVDSEMRQLRRRLSKLLAPPVYQDADTGRLVLPGDFAS